MVLVIDIGNTTTALGCFERKRLRWRAALATHPIRSSRILERELRALLRRHRVPVNRIRKSVLCSVVPSMTGPIAQALRGLVSGNVLVVGRDVRVLLKNRYRHPRQVGQDRLVGAYAAWKIYRRACIVADFGTAITIDVVTKAGEYLGGIIAPGLDISLEALATKTALLPQVKLGEPSELLGRDTASSIRSGVVYGCAALCDGLVTQLRRRYAPQATVIATGGASALMAKHVRTIDHLRPHLVLEGLYQLAKPAKGNSP